MFTKKGDAAVLAKLGEAPAEYREIGQCLHGLVREFARHRWNRSYAEGSRSTT
jgi:hypothetical protein